MLVEQHRIPGGYCTSYRRKGFTFNVPSVMSNLAGGGSYSILHDLGLFDEVEWIEIQNFAKYIYPDCEIVMPANNLEGCRENLKKAFSSEKKAIDNIFSDITTLQNKVFSSKSRNKLKEKPFIINDGSPKACSVVKKKFL